MNYFRNKRESGIQFLAMNISLCHLKETKYKVKIKMEQINKEY